MNVQERNEQTELARTVNIMRATQLAQFSTLQGAMQAIVNELNNHNNLQRSTVADEARAAHAQQPDGRRTQTRAVQTLDDLINDLELLHNRVARLEDGR